MLSSGYAGTPLGAHRLVATVELPQSRPTIKDVARSAHVSTSTASKALRGLPGVSEQTRQAVTDAARRLNYRTNASAAALRSGGRYIVALLVDDTLALRPQDRAEGDNGDQLFSLRWLAEMTMALETYSIDVRVMRAAEHVSADLVVVVTGHSDPRLISGLGFGVPVITVGSPTTTTTTTMDVAGSVLLDHVGMTEEVLSHCDQAGYESVALILPDYPFTHFEAVSQAYLDWHQTRGRQPTIMTHSGTDRDARTAAHTVAQQMRVTGIYTLGNTAAVLGGIQDCGRVIGADVGLVARAEGVIEAGLTPAISTMSMAARQCATVFVDLIRDVRLNGPSRSPSGQRVTAPYLLTPRTSTSGRLI